MAQAIDTTHYHPYWCPGCRGHHGNRRAPIEIALAIPAAERDRLFGPMDWHFIAVEIPLDIAKREEARRIVPWMRPLTAAEQQAMPVTLARAAEIRRAGRIV